MFRKRFLVKSKITSNKQMPQKPNILAIVISILSLLVSLSTFYISNIRVKHSIKVSFDFVGLKLDSTIISGYPEYRVVFQNLGNRTECVFWSYVHYEAKKLELESNYDTLSAPFLIKNGDAVIRNYEFHYNIAEAEKFLKIGDTTELKLIFEYSISGNDGRIFQGNIHLFNFKIYMSAKGAIISHENRVENRNIELIKN